MSPVTIEILGGIAATLTTLAWLPQAAKTVRSGTTRDISLTTHLMLFIGIVLWLAYGVLISSWPLIGANIVTFGLIGTILLMKLRNRD
jgi:MtN3 and saliva related transmembrane protein